ncbi:MAG TPA: crosslink repair DNA glycosylase YcaQ family protein, partial [Vicinamibacterales bacterium]|nr:crosslink repair DNA glycosylase YcaQ family protein [Vicinamibacterales bacterium]
ETYREVLRDHFDMPALVDVLRRVSKRTLRVATIDSTTPSPFAASLLFSYVANYIYDGDAPLAERRAQALSVDQGQLRELLGDAELRELLDPAALDTVEQQLQQLEDTRRVKSPDGIHDLLLRIGDLTREEIEARASMPDAGSAIAELERSGRLVPIPIAGERRYVAVEDAARYRDALGTPLPAGLPAQLLEPVRDPAGDLAQRFARTHGPFTVDQLARRFGLGTAIAESLLTRLADVGRLVQGEFRPGGVGREWVDAEVLKRLRSRSLARLRREVEPVSPDALGRFLVAWHGVGSMRRGPEALLDAIEQLQGASLPFSILERDILPARVAGYQPTMLDTLMAAGEVVWAGVESLGERDGRIALYLTDHMARLRPPSPPTGEVAGRAEEILSYLRSHGASFFSALHDGSGGGFPGETVDALWDLVWQGLVTNDTLHALRAYVSETATKPPKRGRPAPFRSRRLVPPTAEGRWSLVDAARASKSSLTEWSTMMANQLLARHGVVTRETITHEPVAGGFSIVYQVLKAMEDAGRVRRGYFIAGLGAAQFAMPAALDLLRSLRDTPEAFKAVVVSATDPASPYGSLVKWPATAWADEISQLQGQTPAGGPTRSAGALVILVDGYAGAYLRRGERELLLFMPPAEPIRSHATQAVARALVQLSASREEGRRGLLLAEIDGLPASIHPAARLFIHEGFLTTAMGLQLRPARRDPGFGIRDSDSQDDDGDTPTPD